MPRPLSTSHMKEGRGHWNHLVGIQINCNPSLETESVLLQPVGIALNCNFFHEAGSGLLQPVSVGNCNLISNGQGHWHNSVDIKVNCNRSVGIKVNCNLSYEGGWKSLLPVRWYPGKLQPLLERSGSGSVTKYLVRDTLLLLFGD